MKANLGNFTFVMDLRRGTHWNWLIRMGLLLFYDSVLSNSITNISCVQNMK